MVNVGDKPVTSRLAIASASIHLTPETLQKITEHQIGKGDVLGIARLAGIMATKQTANLIPLCHPIRVDSVTVDFDIVGDGQISVRATVAATDRTGVEMEAMTAVSIAALTVYDMCKSVDRSIRIDNLQLELKSGGKSGNWQRSAAT